MKSQHVIILLTAFFVGCNILGTEDQAPGIALYKTKGDYFDLVNIGMKGNEIYSIPGFWNGRYNAIRGLEIKNNDTIFTGRYKLPDGYVLSYSEGLQSVFINMTHKEYLYREMANAQEGTGIIVSMDTLRKYILDKDPYLEFYRNNTDVKRFEL